jgi:hypothetical protein
LVPKTTSPEQKSEGEKGTHFAVNVRGGLFTSLKEKDTYTKAHLFKYEVACMGGTFDHLHLGHRLLLS